MGNAVKYFFLLSLFVLMVNTKRRDRFDIIEKRIGVIETRLNSDNDLAKEMIWSLQQNFEEFNNSMINLKDQMCHKTDQRSVKKEQTNSEKSEIKSSRVLVSLGLEREKQWTRDQVEKLKSQVNEQTDQLTNNFSELRTELIASKEEMDSKLNVSKIDMLKEIETLKEIQTKIVKTLFSANMVSYSCPSDWTKYSSYCYLNVDERKTFSEARAHCKRLGATLSDIENEAEHNFITSLAAGSWIWAGIYYEEKEGHWISERTGQPVSFTNFENYFRTIWRNCAVISGYQNRIWLDSDCRAKETFICKTDVTIDFKSV